MGYNITTPVTGQETPDKGKAIVKRQITELAEFLLETLEDCGDSLPALKTLSDAVDGCTDVVDTLRMAKMVFLCDSCGWMPAHEESPDHYDYCKDCHRDLREDRGYFQALRCWR